MADVIETVKVSRRIGAPASRIFEILADPNLHIDFDGSGMLRGLAKGQVISSVGDVFAMKMYLERLGDYVMVNRVGEFDRDCRISWTPSPGSANPEEDGDFIVEEPDGYVWGFTLTPDGDEATFVTETFDCADASAEVQEAVRNGEGWVEAMTASLERLEKIVAK